MIKINNYKLTPAITATWGDITGDVRNQEDLVEYIKENGTATWGSISGNISDQKDLMNTLEGYATESWVKDQGYLTSTSLTGYATESWVKDQGYLTSTSLTGYATESWVKDQGYLTEHQPLKTINDNSLVGEGNIEIGGLTPEQEDALTPLLDKSEGVLNTVEIKGNNLNEMPWVYRDNFSNNTLYSMVDGSIYCRISLKLYKLNPKSMTFDLILDIISSIDNKLLWMDNSGRMFQGNNREIDLTTGSVKTVNLNYKFFIYKNNRPNLFYGDRGIWCVPGVPTFLKLYDEQLKQFTGTYTTTLPQDYSGDISSDICNVFTYKGHKLFHTKANKTYEVVETDDGLTVTDVTGVYFPIPTTFTIDDPYFIFSAENGNLYYIHNYDKFIYTGTDTWEIFDIPLDYSFNSSYVVSGNYVLGGVYLQNSYSILNVGPTQKITSWSPVNNVAVDLVSDQNISGQKKFDDADIQNLSISLIQTMYGNSRFILGKNTTKADKMEFTVPGKFTLNGVNIATTDNCFINKLIATSGPDYKGICAAPAPYYYNYFKTPSGRLMWNTGNPVYEFDGTQFNQVQTVTVHPKGSNFATITDGLFAIDSNSNLIKWNDETSNWEVIIPLVNSSDYIWAADANTLRAGYTHKLSNTDGTYSWVDDPTANNIGTSKTISYVIGENVYMVSGYDVYKYEESSKTFTSIAYAKTFILRCIVFENNLYYVGNDDIIHKLDFPQDPQDEIVDNYTDIIYTGQDALYIEYNNKLYITNSSSENDFGYCYAIEDTTPEVPATDGTYVLKAVRSGEQVTFSWVTES